MDRKFFERIFRKPTALEMVAEQLAEAERQYVLECAEAERAVAGRDMLRDRIQRLRQQLQQPEVA